MRFRWSLALAVTTAAWAFGSVSASPPGGSAPAALAQVAPPAGPAAPLRVPPYVEGPSGVTRGAAAPTPVALGRAPEVTRRDVGLAAVQQARDIGTDVALVIDGPGTGPQFAGYLPVRGWAADLQPNGEGIDANNVQVWLDGPNGTPLGFAQYGWQRADVAALLGDDHLETTGFRLAWQTCTFAPGDYRLFVYAWRRASGDVGAADARVALPACRAPAGTVLFADPLDGKNPWGRDWSTGASDNCVLYYDRDEYRVRKLAANPADDCAAPDVERTVYGNFAFDVDVRLDDSRPGAFAALGVRMGIADFSSSFLAGYVVRLDPAAGEVTLGYDDGRGYTVLARARPANLRPGTATNRLGVEADGPRLRVQVNGEPALEITDERSPWGTITLGAGESFRESTEAIFRNLVVRRLGDAPTAGSPDPAASRCPLASPGQTRGAAVSSLSAPTGGAGGPSDC